MIWFRDTTLKPVGITIPIATTLALRWRRTARSPLRLFSMTILTEEVSFPEYGPQKYKPTPGSALVFSASILHGVSPVTRGRRYVFLTFLFDEEAEKVRLANLRPVSHSQPDPKCPPSARAR